jgi:hypothetical protein
MDFLYTTLNVILTLALARSTLGLKSKYQQKIEIFDENFSVQFRRFTNLKVIDGVDYLGTILGFSAGFLFILFFILSWVFNYKIAEKNIFFAQSFFYCLIGFLSIKWYTKPVKFSLSFLVNLVFISSLCLFMPFIDFFIKIDYTSFIYNLVFINSYQIGVDLPEEPHLMVMGMILSLYMLTFSILMWLGFSIFLALCFFSVFTISYGVLKTSHVLQVFFGRNTFNAVLIVLFIFVQYLN